MKKTNGIKKGEHMKKILPKMLTLIFVGALVITSTVNIDRNLQAQARALSGNVNELGIDSSVSYSSDNTSAALSVDMSSLDTEKYEVTQVLGPNGEALDLNSPSVNVSDNGDYLIKVQYIDKTAIVEVPVAPEATPEVEPTPSATEPVVAPVSEGVLSGEVSPEGTPEAAVAPVEEVALVVEEVVEQPTPVTVVEPEIKEIELATHVNGIVIAGTQTEEEVVSNPVVENVLGNSYSSRTNIGADINDLFDVDKGYAYGGSTNQKILFRDTNNLNVKVEGNRVSFYNAVAGGGIPTSIPVGGGYYQVFTNIPSKTEVSMKANWTLKGKLKLPVTDHAVWNSSAGMVLESSNGNTNINMVASINNDSVNIYSHHKVNGILTNTSGPAFEKGKYLSTERSYTVSNIYDKQSNSFSLTYNIEGYTHTKSSMGIATFGDKMTLNLASDLKFVSPNFPYGISSYFSFDSFQYDNFNPQFVDMKWFDSSDKEITSDSQVQVGDELTVKASVKNNVDKSDVIPAKLFLSDNQELAATKGVEASGEIVDGVSANLTNETQVIIFKVKVKDTIGDISLGLRLEDDFFHQKQYNQVTSNISVGEIFVDGTPTYTIMNYQRNSDGTIMVDGDGKPTYVEATNQNLLTQDSFVKVEGKLLNPRTKEELTAIVKADLSKTPGLDYANVQDLKVVNGTGTSLENGLTFTLAANSGEGSFEYIVPVKQNGDGTPFNTDEQAIDYTIDGSFVHADEPLPVTGTWLKSDVVSNAGLKPIKDVSVDLTTTEISLERAQQFSLNEELAFATSPNGEGAHLDSIKFEHKHGGDTKLLNMFGLESINHKVGTVHAFADDGTTLPSEVSYNQVILLDDNKRGTTEHYTRLGIGVNAKPRTKIKTINLKVNGGVILPEAYFEIPDYVQLNDQGGIDNTYAGAKATIGIKDELSTTNAVFEVTGDTNFKISNDKQDFYSVSLFNEDKTEMTKVGDIATVGTFDKDNLKKVVWFNTVKDITRTDSIYEGTMTFYITSK